MATSWLEILGLYLILVIAVRAVHLWQLPFHRPAPWLRSRRRRKQAVATSRPLEEIVADLCRLGPRFHHPARGTSRTKLEAVRHAYDRALGEAAAALDIDHLLAVIEPGPELDQERARVEARLWLAGLRYDEAA